MAMDSLLQKNIRRKRMTNNDINKYLETITKENRIRTLNMVNNKIDLKLLEDTKEEILNSNMMDIIRKTYEPILGVSDLEYSLYFNTLLTEIITSTYIFLKSDNETKKVDEAFLKTLKSQSIFGLFIASFNKEELNFSLFKHLPPIEAISSVINILLYRISNKEDFENTKLKLGSDYIGLYKYISQILNSAKSTIILFDNNNFTQGIISLRQMIEDVIILSTLAHYPKTIKSFFYHVNLRYLNAVGNGQKEIDEYLIKRGINPQDLTLRSKYIDYGWLDEIEEFKKGDKRMYRIKSMTKLLDNEYLYEWYASWSNYVHSNFLYVNFNWNKIICEAIREIIKLLYIVLDLYEWLSNIDIEINDIYLKDYLISFEEHLLLLIKKGDFNFTLNTK
jgi:hypothetical protein